MSFSGTSNSVKHLKNKNKKKKIWDGAHATGQHLKMARMPQVRVSEGAHAAGQNLKKIAHEAVRIFYVLSLFPNTVYKCVHISGGAYTNILQQ